MSRIAILYGGRSGEHEVSRNSAASVLKALSDIHEPLLVGIDRDGSWYRQDIPEPVQSPLKLVVEEKRLLSILPGKGITDTSGTLLEVDAVLPIVHGSYGEDGTLQGLLEMARLPYAGSGVLGSAVGMDKEMAKRLWRADGLPVVPWRTLHADTSSADPSTAESLFTELGRPLFVKPANAGSSVGVNRAESVAELISSLEEAWKHDRKLLVEQAISGREIECSVMGYLEPCAFPPGEIVPAGDHSFYDYDAKYLDPDGALLNVPADLEDRTASLIMETAVAAYRSVQAGGLSRVDFLLEEINGDIRIFINEINTLPGMTHISLFPRMAAAGGLDFTAMLEELINGALAEATYREGLSYSR